MSEKKRQEFIGDLQEKKKHGCLKKETALSCDRQKKQKGVIVERRERVSYKSEIDWSGLTRYQWTPLTCLKSLGLEQSLISKGLLKMQRDLR